MKWTVPALLFLLVAIASWSCQRQTSAPVATNKPAPALTSTSDDQIHTILLPRYQSTLPPAPGRDVFATACLSCHSPRYITMQPPLTAVQWDAAVHKMMKVYAAPISEDQIPVIVQYILSTKEKGVTSPWVARTVSAWHGQAFSVPQMSTDKTQLAKDIRRGSEIYKAGCYSCHGPAGRGDGRNAADQLPRPTDFTVAAYTPDALASATAYGVPGTSMPAVPLPEDDMRAIVAFLLQFTAPAQPITLAEPRLSHAKQLFIQNCAACHADSGDGIGPQSDTQPRPPANFHMKQPAQDYAANSIANGIPGSTMPQWKSKLSPDQRQLLVDYVRSLYSPAPTGN